MPLIKTQVTLANIGTFDCYVQADRPTWNGYAKPWFTKEVTEAILRKVETTQFWEFDIGHKYQYALVWDSSPNCTDFEDNAGTVDAAKLLHEWQGIKFRDAPATLFPIGAGEWCWVEVVPER